MQIKDYPAKSSLNSSDLFLVQDGNNSSYNSTSLAVLAEQLSSPQATNNTAWNGSGASIIQSSLLVDFQFLETGGSVCINSAPSITNVGNGTLYGGYSRGKYPVSGVTLDGSSGYLATAPFMPTSSDGSFYFEALYSVAVNQAWQVLLSYFAPNPSQVGNGAIWLVPCGANNTTELLVLESSSPSVAQTVIGASLPTPRQIYLLSGGWQGGVGYVWLNGALDGVNESAVQPDIVKRQLTAGINQYGSPFLRGDLLRITAYNAMLTGPQRANNLAAHRYFAAQNGIYF